MKTVMKTSRAVIIVPLVEGCLDMYISYKPEDFTRCSIRSAEGQIANVCVHIHKGRYTVYTSCNI